MCSTRRITGAYSDEPGGVFTSQVHGFILDGGELETFDVPDAVGTQPSGINDAGQIALDSVDDQARHHGYLLDDGEFTEIRPPGAPTGSVATDISDDGNIVGMIL